MSARGTFASRVVIGLRKSDGLLMKVDISPPILSSEATALPASDRRAYRMSSLDMLRGLVIVVMALDHVRDFFMTAAVQDPTADPTTGPLLFATRWITHFCAPTFVFLAGTSAGLMASRKSPAELASFLLTRGLWLLVLEVLVISTAASFAPAGVDGFGGRTYVNLQVLWAIGASMVILAGAQFLGRRACLAIGAAILLGHNLLDAIWPAAMPSASTAPVWAALHSRQFYEVGPFAIFFNYPLLPWIGVMFLGYGAAGLFELPAKQRDQRLLRIGVSLVIAFILIRALNVYGDPHPWESRPEQNCSVDHVLSCYDEIPAEPSLYPDDAGPCRDRLRVCRTPPRSDQGCTGDVRTRAAGLLHRASLSHSCRGRSCLASRRALQQSSS